MRQLTVKQLLLLNNLIYMNGNDGLLPFEESSEGQPLGDLINAIDLDHLDLEQNYTLYTNGQEWKDIILAVRQDPLMMDMMVMDNYDDGHGGKSVFFTNPSANEAVIVFRGTGSAIEWKDNFLGGAETDLLDGVSTRQQRIALNWFCSLPLDRYEVITVTGHSKGGNKSKYITILEEKVSRCVSFNGQGFSDEFFDTYEDLIARHQRKIENHNIAGDYVNILMNDIGKVTYYKGFNYGDGKFVENHNPNTYMDYQEDGTFLMHPTEQNLSLKYLDEFFNNYLRSLDKEYKKGAMELLGDIFQIVLGKTSEDKGNELLDTLLRGSNMEYASSLIAYFIKYEQTDPDMAESINQILLEMGWDAMVNTVNSIKAIINSDYFGSLLSVANWITSKIPKRILDRVGRTVKEKQGLNLGSEELKKLLHMIQIVNKKIDRITIENNGADRKIQDKI